MFRSNASGPERQSYKCFNGANIPAEDEFKLRIVGNSIIIQELKIYRYPLNQKVIYGDSDLFRIDDGKFEFIDSYASHAGGYNRTQ